MCNTKAAPTGCHDNIKVPLVNGTTIELAGVDNNNNNTIFYYYYYYYYSLAFSGNEAPEKHLRLLLPVSLSKFSLAEDLTYVFFLNCVPCENH